MSRKIFITVILMLFLLPFVSWYYLQSGLNWRKQAQAIMSGTQPFPSGEWKDRTSRLFSTDDLAEHVSIVTLVSCENEKSISSTLDSLYRQFKETKKANFIILNTCKEKPELLSDTTRTDWYVFNCGDSTTLCDLVLANWPSGKTHALIDRNKVIRAYYDEVTKDEKKMLLEHMALLLPRERSDHIELKRGSEK
ncbi:MAG: hypothetical protein IPP15_03830 [Saprospiraceae bacterium]|uniref:Transmembrane protein n=1 Tax=Candidatus Opimibacter skivensis TaxID=2982028 RepID=A0A9D7ST63_9BACT|nr:hypothetical protein [Candidatus Opimibacter skivensis]